VKFKIAVIPGDGIGPEITSQAELLLARLGDIFGHEFAMTHVLAGGAAIDVVGEPLPTQTIEIARESDAILLGAVGGPKWDKQPGHLRPEAGLLKLRQSLGLYANLRPAVLHSALKDACPLRPDLVEGGLDLLVVRELTGGIYFGERGRRNGPNGPEAYDVECYSEMEVQRIAHVAFQAASRRGKKVTSVDKNNVLESSRLWREVVTKVAAEYPEVTLEHMFIDNAAMQLVRNPKQFDVILTSNIFGDILSDEASMITGSIGMLPSASLSEDGKPGLYEPIHGSAPDIANKDVANPIATILSLSMMLRHTLSLEKEAAAIDKAVTEVLEAGWRTADIAKPGERTIGTKEMGRRIIEALRA
jgi:3-isopropylmalate dehydrogenase